MINEGREYQISCPHSLLLVENYIVVHDFCCFASDVIHLCNPFHLIIRLQLFRHTFTLCHLLYQPGKHFLCLLVNVSKVTIQITACEQSSIGRSFMFFQIAFVSLSPYADGLCFFGQFQIGEKIISNRV